MFRLPLNRMAIGLLALVLVLGATAWGQNLCEFELDRPGNPIGGYDVWTEFGWTPCAGAATYRLQIGNDTSFSGAGLYADFDSLTSTVYRPSRDLIMNRTYFWRVIAYNAGRTDSAISLSIDGALTYQEFRTITRDVPRILSCSDPMTYNRTIIPENTPYHLIKSDQNATATFVVPSGLWLAIDSGSEASQGLTLLVDGNIGIEVHGKLLWRGADARRITVMSGDPTPAAGQWQGIYFADDAPDAQFDPAWTFIDGSGSEIVNVDFRHSGSVAGTSTINASMASVYIAQCSFSESNDDHALYTGGGSYLKANYITGYRTRVGNERAGAGIYCQGASNRISQNYVAYCSTYVVDNYGLYLDAKGGGLYVGGSLNLVDSNRFYRCAAYADNNQWSLGARAYGGGIHNAATATIFQDNAIEQCKAYTDGGYNNAYGGGLYTSGDSVTIDGGTITECGAHYGGGIYAPTVTFPIRISHCSIVKDSAYGGGGGIYMGNGTVWASTIEFNKAASPTAGAGIHGDPDTVTYCNLNRNYGDKLCKKNTNPLNSTYAKNNWWYSRTYIPEIQDGIWDCSDTYGSSQLGPVNADPPLYTVSDSTAEAFRNAYSLELMSDGTYSAPLAGGLTPNDTVYFRLTGEDVNPLIKNVAVIRVYNRTIGEYIWPFYEETEDTSGVWQGCFYLTDTTIQLSDSLRVANGDVLDIYVDNDSLVRLRYVVGESECLSAYSGTGNSCDIQISSLTMASGGLAVGDQVGVFDGEFCVGVRTYNGEGFPFTVTAWADDPATATPDGYVVGDDISLRVARAGTCEKIDLCPSSAWTGGDGTFENSTTQQVSLYDDCGGCQTLRLGAGWNFVSMHIDPAVTDITQMFADVVDEINIMSECDAAYWVPGQVQQFTDWDSQSAYAIHLDALHTLQFCGTVVPCDSAIPLPGGWTCAPYYPTEAMDAATALGSLSGELVICNAPDGTFYIPGVGNFMGDMYPGLGYRLNLSAVGTLQYPCAPPKRAPFASAPAAKTARHFVVTEPSQSYHAAVINTGSALADGDELGLFLKDGLLIGSGVVQSGQAPVALWYDDVSTESIDGYTSGAEIEFRVWRHTPQTEEAIPAADVDGLAALGSGPYSILSLAPGHPAGIPYRFELGANYPNPFNPTTTVSFSLDRAGYTTLTVYNMLGQQVRTLVESELEAGPHSVIWNGTDDTGHRVASGVYLYRLSQSDRRITRKMLLLK